MSDGTCWPPSSISTIDDTAHAATTSLSRGHAHATATATSIVRSV